MLNSPPTAPNVSVSPSSPDDSDDLLCIFSGSSDADTDPVTYDIEWFEITAGLSSITGSTLPNAETSIGERWYCEVTPNDGTVDGPTGVSSFVDVTDNTAPDAPVIEPIDPFRNETTVELEGTCEADCDMTFYCADQTFAWQEYTTCASNGTFYHNLGNLLTPGYNTSCYATCTDSAANESGASNQVMTEACLTVDPYENTSETETPRPTPSTTGRHYRMTTRLRRSLWVIFSKVLGLSSDWYKFDTSDDVTADMIAGENNFNFQVQRSRCRNVQFSGLPGRVKSKLRSGMPWTSEQRIHRIQLLRPGQWRRQSLPAREHEGMWAVCC